MAYSSYAYLSKPTSLFNLDEFIDQLSRYTLNNKKRGITGFLAYDQRRFFQYVEGEREVLEELERSLRTDKRHEILVHTNYRSGEKKFDNWSMKVLSISDLTIVVPENQLIDLLSFSYQHGHLINDWEQEAWTLIDQIAKSTKMLLTDH